jgi:TrpR-related protein YerC/YecD
MSNRESILSEKEAHEARVASLIATISALKGEAEVSNFLRDLCTWGELEAMAQRWEVAQLVDEGVSYLEIARRTGASTATVTRVAQWLHHGEGGYRAVLDRKSK